MCFNMVLKITGRISCLKVVAPGNFAGKIEGFNENFRPKNFDYFCKILSQYNL